MSRQAPARGMRDLCGEEVRLRQRLIQTATQIFEQRGGVPIQTPIAERIEVIKNLYGENFNHEVFRLEAEKEAKSAEELGEKGEKEKPERLLLRYDLTVPGIRFLTSCGRELFRRYQIGTVYRRDQPNLKQGRYREFLQCDFDIYGEDHQSGVFDYEILETLIRVLEEMLSGKKFRVQVNDRRIVDQILESCGVPKKLMAPTMSALDKLDKKSLEEIETELEMKGLLEEPRTQVMKMIREFQERSWSAEEYFTANEYYTPPESLLKSWTFLQELDCAEYLDWNPLLARGLAYYTGIIFEAQYEDSEVIATTIASGGRYDEMATKFLKKGKIPAVGLSIGMERILQILQPAEKLARDELLEPKYQVFVATTGKFTKTSSLLERIRLATELRRWGFSVDFSTSQNPKFGTQLQHVFKLKIPVMLVLGEREWESQTIQIKDIEQEVQTEVSRQEAPSRIQEILNRTLSIEEDE